MGSGTSSSSAAARTRRMSLIPNLAAKPALAGDDRDDWGAQFGHLADGSGDRLGDAMLFGLRARVRTWGVDQGEER